MEVLYDKSVFSRDSLIYGPPITVSPVLTLGFYCSDKTVANLHIARGDVDLRVTRVMGQTGVESDFTPNLQFLLELWPPLNFDKSTVLLVSESKLSTFWDHLQDVFRSVTHNHRC